MIYIVSSTTCYRYKSMLLRLSSAHLLSNLPSLTIHSLTRMSQREQCESVINTVCSVSLPSNNKLLCWTIMMITDLENGGRLESNYESYKRKV